MKVHVASGALTRSTTRFQPRLGTYGNANGGNYAAYAGIYGGQLLSLRLPPHLYGLSFTILLLDQVVVYDSGSLVGKGDAKIQGTRSCSNVSLDYDVQVLIPRFLFFFSVSSFKECLRECAPGFSNELKWLNSDCMTLSRLSQERLSSNVFWHLTYASILTASFRDIDRHGVPRIHT